jgi:hypothetical protein
VTETVINTFATTEIDLTLNALDQEVFVVTQVNIDTTPPSLLEVTATASVACSVSSTARTSVGTIANSNVIAQSRKTTQVNASVAQPPTVPPFVSYGIATYDREDPLFAAMDEEYIGIIATSNCHLNIQGQGNLDLMQASVRIYGYRAKMDAAGYAALVQSQVLSA